MLFSKGKEVHKLITKHLLSVDECYRVFCEGMEKILTDGFTLEVEQLGEKVEKLESQADNERHEIIQILLKGALLPESRREILKIIELVDEIANKAEDTIKQIILQNVVFHPELKDYIREINSKTIEQFAILSNVIDALFINYKETRNNYQQINQIEVIESEVDKIENCAIKKLYSLNISLAEKNQLKSIISHISDISDLIEDISDMAEIILVMRKV